MTSSWPTGVLGNTLVPSVRSDFFLLTDGPRDELDASLISDR